MSVDLVRIGTRGSPLALAQAGEIQRKLKSRFPRAAFELVVIKTSGDEFQSVEIFKKKNIGIFTKAIERKLLTKEIDAAVHSLKDVPTALPGGLVLAAIPKRLDARDALVSQKRYDLKTIPEGAAVGTGSVRRKRQIHSQRPDLRLVDIRGNLGTRAAKVFKEKKLDAMVVAKAGLLRLGKYLKFAKALSSNQILPAVGQGALAIEVRKADKKAFRMVRAINHADTEKAALAERSFLHTLQGGCRVPAGIYSKIKKGRLSLKAAVFSTKTRACVRAEISGASRDYQRLGKSLAVSLLKKGAKKFLSEARHD